MKKILVIEDEKDIQNIIKAFLENADYKVETADDGLEGINLIQKNSYDLVLLDIMMPKIDGFVVCEMIRKNSNIPIIILTALTDEESQLKGFDKLADDYITKPFSLMVLRARVDVQLRKSKKKSEVFCDGPFLFDFRKMEFFRDNVSLELSKTEQRLLRCLTEKKGGVSRTQLIDFVWQGDTEYVDDHALTVAVNRLRGKLGEDKECIRTVYGIGYAWVKQ